jgi:hypothetical protein
VWCLWCVVTWMVMWDGDATFQLLITFGHLMSFSYHKPNTTTQ